MHRQKAAWGRKGPRVPMTFGRFPMFFTRNATKQDQIMLKKAKYSQKWVKRTGELRATGWKHGEVLGIEPIIIRPTQYTRTIIIDQPFDYRNPIFPAGLTIRPSHDLLNGDPLITESHADLVDISIEMDTVDYGRWSMRDHSLMCSQVGLVCSDAPPLFLSWGAWTLCDFLSLFPSLTPFFSPFSLTGLIPLTGGSKSVSLEERRRERGGACDSSLSLYSLFHRTLQLTSGWGSEKKEDRRGTFEWEEKRTSGLA